MIMDEVNNTLREINCKCLGGDKRCCGLHLRSACPLREP